MLGGALTGFRDKLDAGLVNRDLLHRNFHRLSSRGKGSDFGAQRLERQRKKQEQCAKNLAEGVRKLEESG